MSFDFRYPNTPANERGWGPGWTKDFPPFGASRPDSYPGEIVLLRVRNATFTGGVRSEIRELLERLIEESLRRGYLPFLDDPGCWGGAFRSSKDPDGNPTGTASNHSWYLAVDINAPHNVYGGATHQIPDDAAYNLEELFREYGFRWLGPPIKDWMHFDFAGTPADAREMLEKARRNGLGDDDMTDEEKARLREVERIVAAIMNGTVDFIEGVIPPDTAQPERKQVARAHRRAASLPEAGAPGPHTHEALDVPHAHETGGPILGP